MRIPMRLLALLAVFGLVVTACGDDDDDTTGADDTTSTTAADGDGDGDGDGGETVDVTLVDYAFEDLPAEVEAGTQLTVTNESETELHELVAFRLPDGEERSAEELAALPPDELIGALGGEPAAVLLATPGSSDTIPAVGDGVLTEPGRYAVFCFIPTGADPAEYLEKAAETEEGPPQVDGGPPHFTQGMYAELTVT